MPVSFPSSNFGTNFNFLKSSILLIDTSIGSRKYKGYTDSEQLLSLVLLNPSGGNAVEHLKFLEEQLVARLQEAPKKPQQLEPVLEVDQETYPWIVERMGVKGAYNYLKRRKQETLDRRTELEEYLEENPEAADTMNAADLEHLGTRPLNDMTLDDL